MRQRRILSLWFPRLAAEQVVRLNPGLAEACFAVVKDENNMQVLTSLSAQAEARGLYPGQTLQDAQAICADLVTKTTHPAAEARFLSALRRWASKYSPWISEEPPASLALDLTGCSHLFGGEEEVLKEIEADCIRHGLSVRTGVADTLGAAWGLARFAGEPIEALRTGDAIDQEARATRSRAAKRRHWERGGTPPKLSTPSAQVSRIAGISQTRQAIAPLPITALRVPQKTVAALARVGLRRVGDLFDMPRASLSKRFGLDLVTRLDQALGFTPEPIRPFAPEDSFATRMSLPDPIGLESDILAGIDRLLPPLCRKMKLAGKGARLVRLQAFRVDQQSQVIEVGLSQPTHEPDRIRPLLELKVSEIDAGFGIDMLRLSAPQTIEVKATTVQSKIVKAPIGNTRTDLESLHDLIGKLGTRIGLERIVIGHPASSHIPEKGMTTYAAAWAEPCFDWPDETPPRPLTYWQPEPVTAEDCPKPPLTFRWRRQQFETTSTLGPERISPEWWLDDPAWRSGVRDYWQITTTTGDRLWLFYAHGLQMSSGWFCQGSFA